MSEKSTVTFAIASSPQIRDEYGSPQKSIKASPFDIFDQIYCLSLPSSGDRRQHIQQEFARVGITQYVFFDDDRQR